MGVGTEALRTPCSAVEALICEISLPVALIGQRNEGLASLIDALHLAGPYVPPTCERMGKMLDTIEITEDRSDDEATTIPLRSFTLPYANAPRTWVMNAGQEAITIPGIDRETRATAAPVGFWNNMPLEEVREVVPAMPPNYGEKHGFRNTFSGVNVREMAMLLGFTYLFLLLAHVLIFIMQFKN